MLKHEDNKTFSPVAFQLQANEHGRRGGGQWAKQCVYVCVGWGAGAEWVWVMRE